MNYFSNYTLLIIAGEGGEPLQNALDSINTELGPSETTIIGRTSILQQSKLVGARWIPWDGTLDELSDSKHPLNQAINLSWDIVAVIGLNEVRFLSEKCTQLAKNQLLIFRKVGSPLAITLPAFDNEYPNFSFDIRRRYLLNKLKRAPYIENSTGFFITHPYRGFCYHPGSKHDFSYTMPKSFDHGIDWEIDRHGFRNPPLPRHRPENEYWIGLFGGSVAASSHSSSHLTAISGFLEQELNNSLEKVKQSWIKRFRVLNLAIGATHQPSQLHTFVEFSSKLNGIITFDGHNEVAGHFVAKFRVPHEYPSLVLYKLLYGKEQAISQESLKWLLKEFADKNGEIKEILSSIPENDLEKIRTLLKTRLASSDGSGEFDVSSYFDPCPEEYLCESGSQFIDRCVKLWADSITTMHKFANSIGIDTLFTLQPFISFEKKLTAEEIIMRDSINPELYKFVTEGHNKLNDEQQRLHACNLPVYSFRDIFRNCSEQIYVDHVHFEDRGNRLVAFKLAELMRHSFRVFKDPLRRDI